MQLPPVAKGLAVNITLPVDEKRCAKVERGRIQWCSEVNNRRVSKGRSGSRSGQKGGRIRGRLEPPQEEKEGREISFAPVTTDHKNTKGRKGKGRRGREGEGGGD